MSRTSLLTVVISLLFMVSSITSHSQNKSELNRNFPIVPFNTNFWNYWDHYWITWLDNHPKYEAIELTTYDNPENSDYKLIRVFLSEKDGSKLQYYYLNDSLAVARTRSNAFLRDITYKKKGKPGEPQGLYLKFKDKDNHLIEWEIDFDVNSKLRRHTKGLTPSIHSVGYILLYHLRTKTVDTKNDKVLFNGTNYAFKNSKNGKSSWYNKDVYSAVQIFGKNQFIKDESSISNSWGRSFKKLSNTNVYQSQNLAKENFIRFEIDNKNQIKQYQQLSFNHDIAFNFTPALPNYITAKDGQVVEFTVTFDKYKNLMNGKVRISKSQDHLIYSWIHLYPDWATWRPFKSLIEFNKKGYKLTTYE